MRQTPHEWTTKEENELVEWIDEAKVAGIPLKDALATYSEQHGLTTKSVRVRYYKVKGRDKAPLEYPGEFGNGKTIDISPVEPTPQHELTVDEALAFIMERYNNLKMEVVRLREVEQENKQLREENEAFNLARKAMAGASELSYTIDKNLNVDKRQ